MAVPALQQQRTDVMTIVLRADTSASRRSASVSAKLFAMCCASGLMTIGFKPCLRRVESRPACIGYF